MLSNIERHDLFDKAFSLINRANELLHGIEERCTKKVADLKASKYENLSLEDKKLLDAQLAHERKNGLI